MKTLISNLDIQIILKELRSKIVNGLLENIYQTKKNIFLFKIHNAGTRYDLIFEPGIRFHLTKYKYPIPDTPPHYTTMLRRFLKRSRILDIKQRDLDRIIIMTLKSAKGSFNLIFEVFSFGNLILVDDKDMIRLALVYRKMRDRTIKINEKFQFPPMNEQNLMSISKDSFFAKKRDYENKKIAKYLSDTLNIGKELVEEICARSKLNPKDPVSTLSDEELERIFTIIEEIRKTIVNEDFKPVVYYDENGNPISATPFEFMIYQNFKKQFFDTFNDALDVYFAQISEKKLETDAVRDAVDQKLSKLEKRLEEQKAHLENIKRNIEQHKEIGDLIYRYLQILETIRQEAYRSIKNKKKIIDIKAFDKYIEGLPIRIKEINIQKHVILLEIEGKEIELDILQKTSDLGKLHFEKYKKGIKKIEGAKKVIEKTKAEIAQLLDKKHEMEISAKQIIKKRREKRWYHKFRWFISSDGFLIIGGKDAKTNEIIVKKYMDEGDIFIHADIHGAPAVVIKTNGKLPPEQTLKEAGIFAVSFSSAWKEGIGNADAYWVKATQVSKTPPSGQYLAKGAFIISGSRNYMRNLTLEASLGLKILDDSLEIVCGPTSAIDKYCNFYIILRPGDVQKGQLTKEIISIINKYFKDVDVDYNEIQAVLPPGSGRISKIVHKNSGS